MIEKPIFISYSRHDRKIMEQLRNSLEKAGLSVWTDQDIRIGDSWGELIEQNIRNAQIIAVILSPNAMKSEWVKQEMRLAEDLNKPIVYIHAGGAENTLPTHAMPIKEFDVQKEGGYEATTKELVDVLLSVEHKK